MAMESSIVIKVKYEETLRRFNARVVNEKLDLNMDALRLKIFQLFNLAPNSELTLTYVDEDGDVVTLVDDEDLQDAMKQYLNPLRISASLSAVEIGGRPSARSSGNSTPLRSPRVQPSFPNLNSGVSDVLKSVPEPLRETVTKLYSDLTSRASSSAPPILAELIDGISKLGLSYYQNQASGSQSIPKNNGASSENAMSADGANPNITTGEPSVKKNEPHTASNNGSRTSRVPASTGLHTASNNGWRTLGVPASTGLHTASNNGSRTLKAPVLKYKSLNEVVGASDKLTSELKALEADQTDAPSSSQGPIARTLLAESGEEKDKKLNDKEKPSDEQLSKGHPVAQPVDMGDSLACANLKKIWDFHQSQNADSSASSTRSAFSPFKEAMRLVPLPPSQYPVSGLPTINNSLQLVPQPANGCPFPGVPVNNPVPPQHSPFDVPIKRSHNHSDATGIIFHRGVRCDGCGVHPITGPRFISKVKENYDLCSICFAEAGNDADYVRVDRPSTYRHPLSFKGVNALHGKLRIPTLSHLSRGRPKLDSRFIQDINVLDGTLMAPLTRFTKIWRMKNNGNVVWPQGTQLVWIGGDRLSDQSSVALEINSGGFAVDQELDVAVDFIAPGHPGRYISYWRMATPFGQKFGQRVWVLIQVDVSFYLPKKERVHEAFQELNLNFPPANNGESGPVMINLNSELPNEPTEAKSSNAPVELVESAADVYQNKEHEANFPINDSLLVGVGDKPSSSALGSTVSYPIIDPIIDPSEEAPAVTSMGPSAPVDELDFEASLLRELEEMGFKQIDLNKKVLRKNEYDLEQSVDDLCGVSEWDPILNELQEMGFLDKEMNKKLLKKNNGSIKDVVMDLIAGED